MTKKRQSVSKMRDGVMGIMQADEVQWYRDCVETLSATLKADLEAYGQLEKKFAEAKEIVDAADHQVDLNVFLANFKK